MKRQEEQTLADAHEGIIRWLELEDMPKTAELEALCFPSAWTSEQFAEAWPQDWFAGYGLFENGMLKGYIVLSVLYGELEVLNIALHPECRGKGLSYPLMFFALKDSLEGGHLSRKGKAREGWERAVLEVRVGNAAARALYTRLGFTEAGCRKNYYSDGEDAVVMTLDAGHFCGISGLMTEA